MVRRPGECLYVARTLNVLTSPISDGHMKRTLTFLYACVTRFCFGFLLQLFPLLRLRGFAVTALASVTRAKLVFVETGCALDGGAEAKLITGLGVGSAMADS